MELDYSKAVVILSGGQDSATCLAWAQDTYEDVAAISFDYGQRHRNELDVAAKVASHFGVSEYFLVDVKGLAAVATSALTNEVDDIGAAHDLNDSLPASFVPNRNAMFITLAHSWAQSLGYGQLVTGVCQTDYSGYPDCRRDFINKLQEALYSGSEADIEISTPLMYLTKAQTWQLADNHDALDFIRDNTLTCYEGDMTPNEWGMGCGECPACKLRAKGYEEFKAGKGAF